MYQRRMMPLGHRRAVVLATATAAVACASSTSALITQVPARGCAARGVRGAVTSRAVHDVRVHDEVFDQPTTAMLDAHLASGKAGMDHRRVELPITSSSTTNPHTHTSTSTSTSTTPVCATPLHHH